MSRNRVIQTAPGKRKKLFSRAPDARAYRFRHPLKLKRFR